MSQDADDGLSDGIQRGGAEDVVAAVEELGLSLFPIEQEVLLKNPIQKGIVANQSLREIGLGGSGLAECLVRLDIEFEHGQDAGLGVANVTAKVGWKKALHGCGYGGFDEDAMPRHAGCSDGRDNDILALEGSSDGVYG